MSSAAANAKLTLEVPVTPCRLVCSKLENAARRNSRATAFRRPPVRFLGERQVRGKRSAQVATASAVASAMDETLGTCGWN